MLVVSRRGIGLIIPFSLFGRTRALPVLVHLLDVFLLLLGLVQDFSSVGLNC